MGAQLEAASVFTSNVKLKGERDELKKCSFSFANFKAENVRMHLF